MGDDLNLDMSGMRIYLHGRELKAVKEITIPPDVEVPEDLAPGHINAFPHEVYSKVKLKPKIGAKPGARWRNLKKAYRMMGVSRIEALLEILRLFVADDTTKKSDQVIVKMGSSVGKSAAPLDIVGHGEIIEGGYDNETLLHFASVHGERGAEQGRR